MAPPTASRTTLLQRLDAAGRAIRDRAGELSSRLAPGAPTTKEDPHA